MKQLEHQIQSSFFGWLKYHPKLNPFIFAIPNGGFIGEVIGKKENGKPLYGKHWITLHKRQKEGLKAGVCDIFCAIPSNGKHGLFIEFKAGKNKPSPEQIEFINNMISQGYECIVCYTLEQAIDCLNKYLTGEVHGKL